MLPNSFKRIKGDRRLIVSITGIACVATCFIHPSLLEPVPENEMEGVYDADSQ